ncbi:flagellar basal body P-ring protein FlgI [Variovorax ginsengisoli]|uniref:Flagellar P-ring protein n=1 Tax=Variovorax ginsengisoli TaxID=363844 RepID=A0ABT8SE42_9BURK|nr:flagellar basal body P-ring protein FlgI [Variovorax ginsengisoli]MDN8618008.1 flagellar basal body P-ring protein FlgI [Variovorax ginsengisoli]MDO1537178.1 flagellar basal body P-ring protein FlgI [Variovorax ginsengisoli]
MILKLSRAARAPRLATHALIVALLLCIALPVSSADAMRVKDLGKVKGWRENALYGTGIVTGLAGTGDSPVNRTTRQSLANVLSQFNLTVAPEQVQSRNVAVVMVSASLPTFAREGDTLDLTVSSAGDARSLVGGTLLLTSLKAANGRVYALAQGPLSVGGYRYDANGNVVQKNHPTTGSIPNGATVEVGVSAQMVDAQESVTFVLAEPDYTTANRVAAAINRQLGAPLAKAKDASGIQIAVPPAQRDDLVGLLTRIENVMVEPDRRARVVINERTGTVVSGGDVRISNVAISHGGIKIAISTENTASQPYGVWGGGPGIRTEIVTNTRIDVEEQAGTGFVTGSRTVSDLVQSLSRLKTSTRDVISILRAVKAAGALHGELVVQ